MNSKERVLAALNWQETDRVPTDCKLTLEMRVILQKHFGQEDVLKCLGTDLREVHPVYPGPMKPSRGDVHYDMFGVGYKKIPHSSLGSYNEAVDLPWADMTTMDEVENYGWPTVDDCDFSTLKDQCSNYSQYAIVTGGSGQPDLVNATSKGRGMEQVLMDIATEDEVGIAIMMKRADFMYEVTKRTLELAGDRIDILHLGEDTATQQGRLVSPDTFESFFRPRIQRFIDLGHEFGCKVLMHSCGDCHDIMPTFIEMGLDVLEALQPEPAGMDPETIRETCFKKLAFCGMISTQKTLPFGTEEECREEARHRLDVIAPGGGYIFAPSHCVQPDTPVENLLVIFDEVVR